MSDDVLVTGDDVYHAHDDDKDLISYDQIYRYIGPNKEGRHIVENRSGLVSSFVIVVKVPAPQYKPFTLDTLPQRHIMVREKGGNHWRDISARSTTGVLVGTVWYEYKDLLEGREMSLSFGDTWQPAGELV